MKCVIYARYSSDGQREESVEGQLRECKEFAERHNMTVVASYIDRAQSARTDDRPEFQKMIRDSAKKQFDVVLVWKLDRFSRNRFDSATYRAILKRNGVKVVSAKENISDGPEGIILEAMLDGMAEYYSAELSVKVKRGQKENALKGKANGGMLPFGYKVNADRYYEIDPLTAPIVLEIFTRYADGQTVKEISAELNSRGIFTNTKYKYTNKASMHNLLKNRRYVGEYRYGDTIIPGGMPAIVPQDIFDRVQKRMEKNKHKPAAMKADEEYILTTKLYCGKDGVMMVGVGGTSKTGKVHHYYKCSNVIYKKSCDKKTVRKTWIERHIAALTRDFVLRDEIIVRLADAIVELQKQENTTIPFLQKQLDDVEKRIGNILNSIEEGLANASVKQRLDELETKKADLEIALAREKIEKTALTKEQIVFWISKFKNGDIDDPAYRKSLVDIFINSIFLYEDKLVITFNWKDGNKTVSLAELEAADEAAGISATAGEVLNINDFRCSHLDGNRPPIDGNLSNKLDCFFDRFQHLYIITYDWSFVKVFAKVGVEFNHAALRRSLFPYYNHHNSRQVSAYSLYYLHNGEVSKIMITSILSQEQINKSIELLNKIRTDEGELLPCYVNGEDEKHDEIENGIVRFFDDGDNAGVFASLIYWGLYRIFIAFEKDTDKYTQELAELIYLVKEKNPGKLPRIHFIAEQKKLIEGIMHIFQFEPPGPNGLYYSSREFVMDMKHFKGFTNDKQLENKSFEADKIDDYALLLDNAMTFSPHNFQSNKTDLAEKIKERVFSAFYKNNELVGLYWLDGDSRTIEYLAVAPAHQRLGYGSIIFSHAIDKVLNELKQERVILYCVDWNEKGLAFYKKFGMIMKGHTYSMNLIE